LAQVVLFSIALTGSDVKLLAYPVDLVEEVS
jgi:hypothetical protein